VQPDEAPDTATARTTLADRIGGPLWVVLGAAIVVGAWRLERMEAQGVKWFGTPGLVPGLLGIAMALAGVALSLRAWRATQPGAERADAPDLKGIGLTLLLCLAFAVGLVGHGLPFAVATGLYLFVHIGVLQWRERRAAGQTGRGLAIAAAVAVGVAIVVPLVFEQIFLVRLP
jgi:hypothetical protein